VTIVDTVVPEKSTRHHLLWIVVSLSLALNLFFVAGALWTRLHAPAPLTREGRFDEMAAALALDPQQRQAFARYSETMRTRLLEMRDATQPLVRAAWSEVAKPQADETKVTRLLDQAEQTRHGYLGEITAATIAFLKVLSPPQRAKFVKVAHQGPPPWSLQFQRRNY
jgi:uncharacterized membrane protein